MRKGYTACRGKEAYKARLRSLCMFCPSCGYAGRAFTMQGAVSCIATVTLAQ